MTLNAAMARTHARAINRLSPSCAYVDACDVNTFRYAEMVKNNLDLGVRDRLRAPCGREVPGGLSRKYHRQSHP